MNHLIENGRLEFEISKLNGYFVFVVCYVKSNVTSTERKINCSWWMTTRNWAVFKHLQGKYTLMNHLTQPNAASMFGIQVTYSRFRYSLLSCCHAADVVVVAVIRICHLLNCNEFVIFSLVRCSIHSDYFSALILFWMRFFQRNKYYNYYNNYPRTIQWKNRNKYQITYIYEQDAFMKLGGFTEKT